MTKKFNSFYLTLLVVLTGALIVAPTVTVSAASDTVTFHASAGGAELSTPYYATDGETVYVKASDGTTSGGNKEIVVSSPDSGADITVLLNDDGSGDDQVADDGVFWGSFSISSSSTDDSTDQILVNEGNAATADVDLDGAGDGTTASVTADYTDPAIDSVETVQAGAQASSGISKLEIVFTDTGSGLDADSVAPSDFALDTGSGSTQIASGDADDSVSVSGNTVTLSYDASTNNISDLDTGGTPDVTIASEEGVDDVAGNELTGSEAASVTALDKLAPVVDSVTTNDTDSDGYLNNVVLSMSETLTSNSPSTAAFSVTDANGDALAVDSVSASSSSVTVTLSDDKGTTGKPTLSYDSGYSVEVKDDADTPNALASVSPAVTDGAGPVLMGVTYSASSAPRDPETLELEFSETIALVGEAANDYSVAYDTTDDGSYDRSITATDVSNEDGDDVVDLTVPNQSLFTNPGNKFEVTVSNDGSNEEVKDVNGVEAANVSETSADVSDFAPGSPVIVPTTKTVNRTTVQVTFGEALETASVDSTDFEVSTGQDVTGLSNASDDDGKLQLDLGSEMATDATPDVTIVSGGSVSDYAGNTQSDYTYTDTEDGVAPLMDSAETTSTTTIEVTFSEELDTLVELDASWFEVGSSPVTPDSVSYLESGEGVELTLAEGDSFGTGDTPAVDYTASSLADAAGNTVDSASADITSANVSDGVAPKLETITWSDNQSTGTGADEVSEQDVLTLTFSESSMDESTITSSNINTNMDADFGTGPTISWSGNSVSVTLASGEGISEGDSITPTTAVKDSAGNGAASVSAKVLNDTQPVIYDGTYYSTIQNAIDAASAGDVIEVTEAYAANDSFSISVNTPVTIKAAAGADTMPVIDASTGSTKVFEINTTGEVIIDGLEIISGDGAHAIQDTAGSTLVVKNSAFGMINTTTSGNKAAIHINSSDSDFLIENNEFGVADSAGSSFTVDGTSYDTTTNYTSGIYLEETNADEQDVIRNNEFGNLWLGMQTTAGSFNLLIEKNVFAYLNKDANNEAIWIDNGGTSSYEIVENDFEYLPRGVNFSASVSDTTDADYNVEFNNFVNADLSGDAVSSVDSLTLDATDNYWNDKAGPGNDGSDRTVSDGDAVGANVSYDPWLDAAFPDGESVTLTGDNKIDTVQGWQMLSVSFEPVDTSASAVFGTKTGALFYWNGSDYVSGNESGFPAVDPKDGYWLYESSATTDLNLGNGLAITHDVTKTLEESGWHMISAPAGVGWANVEVSNDGGDSWVSVSDAESNGWMDGRLWAYNTEDDEYNAATLPGGTILAGEGFWVSTDTADLMLKLPFSSPSSPSAAATSLEAAGFEPVAEGEKKPPAPPAKLGASGELKATAAVTSEGVTFEVSGADVQSMNVQVFNTNGAEIFSESASGNSLSWDAEVANGVYLYGVSAEVDGETKPLGIQKLLILE